MSWIFGDACYSLNFYLIDVCIDVQDTPTFPVRNVCEHVHLCLHGFSANSFLLLNSVLVQTLYYKVIFLYR